MSKLTKIILFVLATLPFIFSVDPGLAQDFRHWEEAIAKLEKSTEKPVKRGKYILFTGSSSIVGWTSLAADFPGKKILNHGFGGSQTFEVVHFADRIITPYKPKQVVIYAGDNDIAAGKSPEVVFEDFKTLFNKIRAGNRKTFITFISIKPSPSRKKLMPAIVVTNRLIREYLTAQKRTSYADVYTAMLLPDGNPRPELFKSDSLHMVPAGYKLWTEILKPHLK